MRYHNDLSNISLRDSKAATQEDTSLQGKVQICGIGSAFPEKKYTQSEI